ncbi:MAG: iron-only hydrogenase system regulator [Clostridiales bacterium]|nr:iron-only hydrogenase system regulator [Clostridiales bacterium]
METRVAIIGIIVENLESAAAIHALLHENAAYIVGRMGIPYREKNMSILSVAVDAPNDAINSLTGKIGRLPGVSAKAAYATR